MRRKLVALLGGAFVAAVLASPVLAGHQQHPTGGGKSGSTIIAGRD
jgi:hypothetical protein